MIIMDDDLKNIFLARNCLFLYQKSDQYAAYLTFNKDNDQKRKKTLFLRRFSCKNSFRIVHPEKWLS